MKTLKENELAKKPFTVGVALKEWALLLRPLHWSKNFIVFLPLVFAQKLFSGPHFMDALFMFGLFCLTASSIYILNDLVDNDKDRRHAEKKKRPLASGAISLQQGFVLVVLLVALSLSLAWSFKPGAGLVITAYLVLQALYSLWWQKIPVLDLACIASGFVLRAAAGAIAIDVPVSFWMLLCAFLWAFFIAAGKRYGELSKMGEQAVLHRSSFRHSLYHPVRLQQITAFFLYATAAAYLLYSLLGEHSALMVFTAPLVTGGLLRYRTLLLKKGLGSNPEKVLYQDRPLLAIILAWLILSACILYLVP